LKWLPFLTLAACGVTGDPGLEAQFRVEDAQYVPGAMPEMSGGPDVTTASLPNVFVDVGERGLPIDGALAPGSNGAAIGMDGDAGYWIVPAGTPDVFDPNEPTISGKVDFSRLIAAGDHQLEVQALDADGHAGAPFAIPIKAFVRDIPDGTLVFTLRWDSDADLDLHVITPDGIEVWRRNVNSYVPPGPGEPPDPPDAWMAGGILDADSNSDCVIDGADREDVVWTQAAPAGTYVVRVDTYSLCGVPAAPWVVEVRDHGVVVATVSGLATAADAQLPHDTGAGVHALDHALP
jgi:hypothetical protein